MKKGTGRPTNGYRVKGKRVPSVTTINGRFKESGPLMYWAWNTANEVLEESLEVIKNYSQAHKTTFLRTDPLTRANFRDRSKAACTAGSIAHDLVEMWIHSRPDLRSAFVRNTTIKQIARDNKTDTDIATAAYNSFQAFVSWTTAHQFKLEQTELALTSEYYRYGGTIDCIGYVDNKLCLFDWKTSGGLYTDYLLQLAAYGILWEEKFYCQSCFDSPEDYHESEYEVEEWERVDPNKMGEYRQQPILYPGDPNCTKCRGKGTLQPLNGYHLIRFDKQTADFQHVFFPELEQARKMFLLYRECYEIDKELKKRI